MKERLKRQLPLKVGILLGYGIFALLMYRLGVSCLFLRWFSVPCPGCGMTRALVRLLHLDFEGAFFYHPMVFFLPIMVISFLFSGRLFKNPRWDKILWIAMGMGFLLRWLYVLLFDIF